MGGREGDDWCMTGDPCPRCGSTQTIVTDVYMLRQHGKIRGAAVPAGRNKVYAMYCYGCGLTAHKRGIPGREPLQHNHAKPSAPADRPRD